MGVETSGVVTAHIALPTYRYTSPQQHMEFFLKSESALRRLPGVSAVGMSDSLPPAGNHGRQIYSNIAIADQPHPPAATGGMVTWRWVTPDYFKALNIPIVRGQAFSENQRTSSERFMILSSLLAARLFGNANPIGQHLQPVPNGPWYTILGVAANVRNAGLTAEDEPEFYQLRRNLPEDRNRWDALVLKASLPPDSIAPWVRAQIATVDPTVPVDIETLGQTVTKLADRPRFETALLGFFAFCGLLMAVIGLYGVISFVATQRTQEIGVRMALGATRLNILRLIAAEGVPSPLAETRSSTSLVCRTSARLMRSRLSRPRLRSTSSAVSRSGAASGARWSSTRTSAPGTQSLGSLSMRMVQPIASLSSCARTRPLRSVSRQAMKRGSQFSPLAGQAVATQCASGTSSTCLSSATERMRSR